MRNFAPVTNDCKKSFMNKIYNKLRNLPQLYLTSAELAFYLDNTTDSRQSLIKRAVADGLLIRAKRKLYYLSDQLTFKKPHPYELAYRLYPPAIISCESALSYHGLIPETVYVITSVTPKRRNKFSTSQGNFDYLTVPSRNFMTSVFRIKEGDAIYFMASVWRAIADYVYCNKMNWLGHEPLWESLRIEPEELPRITSEDLSSLLDYYQDIRVKKFLTGIHREQENDNHSH